MTRWFYDIGWLLTALLLCLCSCAPKPRAVDREILWSLEQFQEATSPCPEGDALEGMPR